MGCNSSKQVDMKEINIDRIDGERDININQTSANSTKQDASADVVGPLINFQSNKDHLTCLIIKFLNLSTRYFKY